MSGNLLLPTNRADEPQSIALALESIRRHLGMEVAYISEFVDGHSVFRVVDAPGLEALIKVGDSRSLDDVYCRHILEGRLPELMADTAAIPFAASLPMTAAVGAHMSVPIRLPGGDVYGMFCCLSPYANASLNERDLGVMRVFADMAAGQLGQASEHDRRTKDAVARIERVIEHGEFNIVLQPIWAFGRDRPIGFEALSRFTSLPLRAPDVWFEEAANANMGVRLEVAAMTEALKAVQALPDDLYLSVNASPATILSGELSRVLAPCPLQRVVLEITEHSFIDDYAQISVALAPLRVRGLRVAVDDAGAGYASFRHVLRLAPDIIKLDMGLTRSVDTDVAGRALVSAMTRFANETHSQVVAEGVETEAEWRTLHRLGIELGQGFFLGRPADLASALALLHGASEAMSEPSALSPAREQK